MPPKFKFTRQEIIDTATELVRENGMDALTARNLAEKLGSSAKPIFTLFENMKEVSNEVIKKANGIYNGYIKKGMENTDYPPYKASGMAYIQFASEEKQLFKLLFMRDRTGETVTDSREEIRDILNIIMKNLEIDEDTAFNFHLEVWIYVHGIATMIATSYLKWDTEFISRSLTDVYKGLSDKFKR